MNSWQQLKLLMQPAFIRLVDQIGKQLGRSDWTGVYETIETWPEGTTPETKAQVSQLQEQLEKATPEQTVALEEILAYLPQPEIDYLLCLKKQDDQVEVNLWELCYQVCLSNYNPLEEQSVDEVQVDTHLIDAMGEVDWHLLDHKARQVVEQVFKELPAN
jgi:hypothetical protein